MDPIPFLDLTKFQTLWDGASLNSAQQNVATLLLTVASNWIYARKPGIGSTDMAAQLVVFEVVSNSLRYGKYAPLKEWSRTTMHKMDSGTLSDPESALDFTDRHKDMLGIPIVSVPLATFAVNDFDDQNYGNPATGRYPFLGVGFVDGYGYHR